MVPHSQEKVVQVVMDSAASCLAAGKLLTEKYPNTVSYPCSAHCLDLLLEDIGKLHWVGAVINQGKEVVKFITNHQQALAINPAVPQTPIVGVYREAVKIPMNTEFEFIFSSRGVRSTSRQFCRIIADETR